MHKLFEKDGKDKIEVITLPPIRCLANPLFLEAYVGRRLEELRPQGPIPVPVDLPLQFGGLYTEGQSVGSSTYKLTFAADGSFEGALITVTTCPSLTAVTARCGL